MLVGLYNRAAGTLMVVSDEGGSGPVPVQVQIASYPVSIVLTDGMASLPVSVHESVSDRTVPCTIGSPAGTTTINLGGPLAQEDPLQVVPPVQSGAPYIVYPKWRRTVIRHYLSRFAPGDMADYLLFLLSQQLLQTSYSPVQLPQQIQEALSRIQSAFDDIPNLE